MSPVVRAATPGDVAALHGLVQDHAVFERGVASLALPELAAVIASDQPPAVLLVAAAGGALVGYAAVTFDWSLWRARRYGHLDCLFVMEQARGSGVGARLLDAAARLARAHGADRLEWQTPSWNEGAIRFYRRAGAERADKARFGLSLHDLCPQPATIGPAGRDAA